MNKKRGTMTVEKNEKTIKVSFEGEFDQETEYGLERLVTGELNGMEELYFDMEYVGEISNIGFRILKYTQNIMQSQCRMYVEHVDKKVEEFCRRYDIMCI